MILIIIMAKLMVQHLYTTMTDDSLGSPKESKSVTQNYCFREERESKG